MKLALMIGASGMAAGGLYAGGVLDGGEVYNLPIAEVRAELAAMPVPPILVTTLGGSDGAAVSLDEKGDAVRWRFSIRGKQMSVMTARLEAEGPRATRVVVERSATTSDPNLTDRISSTRFMRSFAETSFREAIDARLEGRAFEFDSAMEAFGRHAVENPEEVRELGLAVSGMFNEVAEQAATTAYATRNSPATTREQMRAAVRPSVTLPPQYVDEGGQ